MCEPFVDTKEKVAADRKWTAAYADWSQEDKEASAIRRGALAAADRWRDE